MEFEQTKCILAAFERHGVNYPAIQYVPPTGDFWIDTVRPQDRLDAQARRERFDLPEE